MTEAKQVCSIMVVGALTRCVFLFYYVFDLIAAQMKVQHSLIWEIMLYELKLYDKSMEAAKNLCWMKDESTAHQTTVMR